MDMIEQLAVLKGKIIRCIRKAADDADIEAITNWSRAAEQCEALIRDIGDLERRVTAFVDSMMPKQGNFLGNQVTESEHVRKPLQKGKVSPKREGAIVRESWVQMMVSKGIRLDGHDKRYYTEGRALVSIAFANEIDRPQLVDKWFLGFKDEPTDFAVLLCRDKEGTLHDLIIPITRLGASWNELSRSGGQAKFNVQRRKGRFLLSIPGSEPMDITKYRSNYGVFNNVAG